MRSMSELEELFEQDLHGSAVTQAAERLQLGEELLEQWLTAHDVAPTTDKREGFRILALHRQGAKLDPSFNACRETCRELVYYYNLISLDPDNQETDERLDLMGYVAKHLYYFISGKMQDRKLGEFCCAARPVRLADASSS